MIKFVKVKDRLPEIVSKDGWSNTLLLYYQYKVNNKIYYGYGIGYYIQSREPALEKKSYSWYIRFKDGKDQNVLAWCELPDKLYEQNFEIQ